MVILNIKTINSWSQRVNDWPFVLVPVLLLLHRRRYSDTCQMLQIKPVR